MILNQHMNLKSNSNKTFMLICCQPERIGKQNGAAGSTSCCGPSWSEGTPHRNWTDTLNSSVYWLLLCSSIFLRLSIFLGTNRRNPHAAFWNRMEPKLRTASKRFERQTKPIMGNRRALDLSQDLARKIAALASMDFRRTALTGRGKSLLRNLSPAPWPTEWGRQNKQPLQLGLSLSTRLAGIASAAFSICFA